MSLTGEDSVSSLYLYKLTAAKGSQVKGELIVKAAYVMTVFQSKISQASWSVLIKFHPFSSRKTSLGLVPTTYVFMEN